MKKRLITLTGGTAVLVIGLFLYSKYSDLELKKKPQMYVYETFMGPANGALIIENLDYKDSLIEHYVHAEKYREYSPFNFPLKTLPMGVPVYVTGYTEDSLLAKVVSDYYRGAHMGSYTSGYVYYKTLHSTPPPEKGVPTQ